jgi:signal transduction histidine kinase
MESDIKFTLSVVEKEEYKKDIPTEVFKELHKILDEALIKLDAAKDATRLVLKLDSVKNIMKILNKDDTDVNTLMDKLEELKKI